MESVLLYGDSEDKASDEVSVGDCSIEVELDVTHQTLEQCRHRRGDLIQFVSATGDLPPKLPSVDSIRLQHRCRTYFSVYRTKLLKPTVAFSMANNLSNLLSTLAWDLPSNYYTTIMCCTPGADPIRLESLYRDSRTSTRHGKLSEVDQWIHCAECCLSSSLVLATCCSLD